MSNEKQLYASRLWWDSKNPVQKEESIELYSTGRMKKADELTSIDVLEMWRCFMLTVASKASRK